MNAPQESPIGKSAENAKPQQMMSITRMKLITFVVCLLPLAWLCFLAWQDDLGANPIEYITRETGVWTLRLLLLTLCITPLRKLTSWHALVRLRRMLGLFTFFYAVLHFLTYVWLDQFFDFTGIVMDVYKRPFITVGFAAFVLLIPLAVTSSNAMVRMLGGRRWQALHRTVYAIAILAVTHYLWLVKKDMTRPLIYAAIVLLLLAVRAWWREQERRAQLAGKYGMRVAPPTIPQVVKFFPKRPG